MLEGKYNAKEAEKKWQKFWEDLGIYKFDINTPKEKIYSIDNPPPTVSGKIHIGHVFSYSQTEMLARYKRLRGYNIFYPFGFSFIFSGALFVCSAAQTAPGSASDCTYVWRQVCDPGGCNPSGSYSCQSRPGEQWRRDRGLSFHDLKFFAL